jgi:hypothetical protein
MKDIFYICKKGKKLSMKITKFTVRFRSLERFDIIPGRFNPKQSRNLEKKIFTVYKLNPNPGG